jgi:hypothetical protein
MIERQTSRRGFLLSAGVSLALPLLESRAGQAPARSGQDGRDGRDGEAASPRRLVAMNFALGLHGPNLFPREAGRGYTLTPYLESLGRNLRDHLTVMSGLSHPEVTLGHASDSSFLTAARFPGAPTFRNSISIDQLLAERLRPNTRFASLTLGTRSGTISFSRSGVLIPPETRPSALFTRMFVNGTPAQVAAQVRRLEDGQSVMDAVLPAARQLQREVSAADHERLDQYFSAVRDVEQRLVSGREWARRPRPTVNYAPPRDVANPNDDVTRLQLMLDLVHLAVQTDSSRYITLYIGGSNAVQPIDGVSVEYHSLSHHGQDPEKLAQLRIIQTRQMEAVGQFLARLRQSTEAGQTLLDRTAVLVGSAMGNASSHNCKNLPIILAGGGFRHGQHLVFDSENNTPLARLYVSMLQRLGLETDQFVSGRGTLPGLEMV